MGLNTRTVLTWELRKAGILKGATEQSGPKSVDLTAQSSMSDCSQINGPANLSVLCEIRVPGDDIGV